MALPELPSKLLLKIFSFLPSLNLLRTVRSVCRLWRQLALAPSLWADRSLLSTRHSDEELELVLRLAPCLWFLQLWESSSLRAALRSECAATQLELNFFGDGGEGETLQEAVLQRQVEAGGLRAVRLRMVPPELAVRCVRLALEADLVGLSVSVMAVQAESMDPSDFPVSPCLRALHFTSLSSENCMLVPAFHGVKHIPWLERLVQVHVATLESVTIAGNAPLRVFELLATCPRLRVADLPGYYVDELGKLCALSCLPALALEELTLRVRQEQGDMQPLVPHFRSAAQLRELCIDCPIDEMPMPDSVVDLVAALGWSGQSELATLQLLGRFTSPATALAKLPQLLSWLPRLHTLELFDWPPPGALEGITPGVAASLRLLRVGSFIRCGGQCAALALHELVRRMPLLHVMATFRPHFDCEEPQCACCAGGLHPSDHFHRCLFAHGPAEECGCAEHSQHTARCTPPGRCTCSHVMERVPEVPPQWRV